jgi:hypothetical protein
MDPNFMMNVIGDRASARGHPVKHPLMHRTRTVDYAVILAGCYATTTQLLRELREAMRQRASIREYH